MLVSIRAGHEALILLSIWRRALNQCKMGAFWSYFFGRRFTVNEVGYRVVQTIGEGGFSFVFRVRNSRGEDFALKRILIQVEDQREAVEREVHMYKRFRHDNIAYLVDHTINKLGSDQSEALLLFPYYRNGSLCNLVDESKEALDETYIISLIKGVCEAIQIMHCHPDGPIAHRDITITNLLLSNDRRKLLLTDLGSAAVATVTISSRQEALALQEHSAQTCTAAYRPPELFEVTSNGVITAMTDIWSLGCCLYATAFGCSPFDGSALAAVSGHVRFPRQHNYSNEFCDLIGCMLMVEPSSRPDITQVISTLDTMSTRR